MAASSSWETQAAGTASGSTPWRSGFCDPPVNSNVQWKNKKKYEVEKLRVPRDIPRLNWNEWSSRLNGLLLGKKVEPQFLHGADWSQDGLNGRPIGILVQLSKALSYELRHNLPTYESYNKRTGTIDLQELFRTRHLNYIRSIPELFYLACVSNPKGRYILEQVVHADGTVQLLISAAQGHSSSCAPEKEDTCTKVTKETLKFNTKFAIHGTSVRSAQSIIKDKHIYPGGINPNPEP